MIKFTQATEQAAQPELPTAILSSFEMLEDGTLRATIDFPQNYPESAIKEGTRKEKDASGKETGEERVTSKTYGLGRNLSTGLQDPDGNLLEITSFLRARTPAEKAAASAPETIE